MTDEWPFDDVFLWLDGSATIRRVVGQMADRDPLEGLSWHAFVNRYADSAARDGLRYGWSAIAEGRVAPVHWPPVLPFKAGTVVALRPAADGMWAAHLIPTADPHLDDVIGGPVLNLLTRLARVSRYVYRGMDGPLTDAQVRDIGSIVNQAEQAQHLLHDLRAELLLPATSAPLPRKVADLFTYSNHEFAERRVTTHQLGIGYQWSSEMVYCQPGIRSAVQQIIHALLPGISARSLIHLLDCLDPNDGMIHVEIRYHGEEEPLQFAGRIEPLALDDPKRTGASHPVVQWVTAAQAYLAPVRGRAWAESCCAPDATGRIILALPRWRSGKQD